MSLPVALRARPDLDRQITPQVRVRGWSSRLDVHHAEGAHPTVEVSWVQAGRARYHVGRRDLDVVAGQAVVIPSQVVHCTSLAAGTRAGAIWLGSQLVVEVGDAIGRRAGSDPWTVAGDRIAALGELLRREAEEPGEGQALAGDALGEALACTVLRSGEPAARRGVRDPRIAAALERILGHYAEPLDVDELARTARMSRFHFGRLFREQVGMSPYRTLLRTRIERAAELLRAGRCSVTEAALTVGFRDLGRFGRAFRERFGCAPGEMRARG
jgi:AraC-like DNA-binding protein